MLTLRICYHTKKRKTRYFGTNGEYIDHNTVKSWVNVDVDMPVKEGLHQINHNSMNFSADALTKITFVSHCFNFICQFILSKASSLSLWFPIKNPFIKTTHFLQRTYVSTPFEITENNSAADFDIIGNLDNNWLETDLH